jgi:hypothetical protein
MAKKTEKLPDMNEMIQFIRKCADIEGTELGETWDLLLSLHKRCDFIGDEMKKALEKELEETYNYLKKKTKIEERTINRPQTVMTLVFLDEEY